MSRLCLFKGEERILNKIDVNIYLSNDEFKTGKAGSNE